MRVSEIILEVSKRIQDQVRTKFKKEDPSLTDDQIDYYLENWDRFYKSFPSDSRDITRLSFEQMEKLVDAAVTRKALKGKKTKKKDDSKKSSDLIYNKNNMAIYRGDNKESCIEHGEGYSFCISRPDSSNLFNRYRYGNELTPVFYFVVDQDKPQHDVWHIMVIHANVDGSYKVTTAANAGDTEMSWDEIVERQPKLEGLQNLLKPKPLTPEEIENYKKLGNKIPATKFSRLSIQDKIMYIEFGNELTDEQQSEITKEMLSMYSKHNPHKMTSESWNRLSPSDFSHAIKNLGILIGDNPNAKFTKLLPNPRKLSDPSKQAKLLSLIPVPSSAIQARDIADQLLVEWGIRVSQLPDLYAVIAKNPRASLGHAILVINHLDTREESLEPTILKDDESAYQYAEFIARMYEKRLPEFDKVVLNSHYRSKYISTLQKEGLI